MHQAWCLFLRLQRIRFATKGKSLPQVILNIVGKVIAVYYYDSLAAAAAKSLQSCRTLCNPMDCSPPGSTIPGILQARTLGWVAIAFSSASKWKVKVRSLSRDPMDCSPPGSSAHGIFQAGGLEWVPSPSPMTALDAWLGTRSLLRN